MVIEILTHKQQNILNRIKHESHIIGHWLGFEEMTEDDEKFIHKVLCEYNSFSVCKNNYLNVICLALALLLLCKPKTRVLFLVNNERERTIVRKIIKKILKSRVFKSFSRHLYNKKLGFGGQCGCISACILGIEDAFALEIMPYGKTLCGKHEKNLYITYLNKDKTSNISNEIESFEGRHIFVESRIEK